MNYYIVGCGGVCTYFLPAFLKMLKHHKALRKSEVFLVDGDKIELKNYDRQIFEHGKTGCYKAEVLKEQYANESYIQAIHCINEYITDSFMPELRSTIIGFVDNHPARRDMLAIADRTGSRVIFGANSDIGAHAYYYDPKWVNSELDPRVRFPELMTVETGSPLRAEGCNTDKKLDDTPQTSIANQLAASHALYLWHFWTLGNKDMNEESFEFWPVETRNTFSRFQTVTVGDIKGNDN